MKSLRDNLRASHGKFEPSLVLVFTGLVADILKAAEFFQESQEY